ncbi:riboflavin kinase [Cristinia sonorae]|uniref:Riboflavin kinase n=1 Tax=Cristinia sonorae TaxID=1940300 RepID=A0A8K0UWU1_9AGAR|nr:riboflavin kinase [Cristinia sonorae]
MVQTAADLAGKDLPAAPVRTESSRRLRPDIVGPEIPGSPFPIYLSGDVQRGFGRGGKDLGCPTANLPDESLPPMSTVTQTGVYFGYAQVPDAAEGDNGVLPMVMSLGYNPFYGNKQLTAEIHIMHEFKSDFYGRGMKAVVLGYIRPELDYVSREGLIEDIETDKRVALKSLARPGYEQYQADSHFTTLDQQNPKL